MRRSWWRFRAARIRLGCGIFSCGLAIRRMDFISVWESMAGSIILTSRSGSLKNLPDEHNLKLHIVDIEKEYGQPIPVLSEISHRGHGKPCAVCGLAKRHEMNRIARDLGYDVLATGHNLDDEAAVLFGNTLSWSSEYLLRQGPVLPASDGLARKVKPLCRFYEREMTAYCLRVASNIFMKNVHLRKGRNPFITRNCSTNSRRPVPAQS